MRIGCSRCQAQYDLPDEKLERGAAKIRCTQCGHVFVVKRRRPEPPLPTEAPEAGAADFNFDLSAVLDDPTLSSKTPDQGPRWGDLDLGAPNLSEAPNLPAEAPPSEAGGSVFDLGLIDFPEAPNVPEGPAGGPPVADDIDHPSPSGRAGEAKFDDFDFGSFDSPDEAKGKATSEPERAPPGVEGRAEEDFFSATDELPSLGELDLGEFDDASVGGFDEDVSASPRRADPPEPPERVSKDELLSPPPPHRGLPIQDLAEEIPRLDLQRGPRRSETAGALSPRSRATGVAPLFWVVILAIVATGGYTGYNAYRHPEALTFLNPQRIRELWRNRDVESKFATEEVKGYGQDLPGGRRVFVVRGRVINKSGSAQGLIRVRGNLFGRDGAKLATEEVYCGNQLSDRELAVLPRATIEARLQNQVGEALSNVDVASGSKVPFMLVFPAPSTKVENFNVLVSAWRGGGS